MSSHALPIPSPSDRTSDSIPDLDLGEIDIHGKLIVLNAIDLSSLTLARRCAMVLLQGPWLTDDLGRFMSHPGALPDLSPLSKKQASSAIRGLTDNGLVKTWQVEASLCWEVAGAYTFKKGLKKAIGERIRIANEKKTQRAERKKRREARDAGLPYIEDDDGGGVAKDGDVIEMIRTSRGGHVPMQPTMFYNSKVPVPKGKRKLVMVAQPSDEKGCLLHMYPSFNVYAGLNALGVLIRHQLLWEADDFGRVRIDISRLHSELGPAITKRVSMRDIEVEIQRMNTSGHLLVFSRASGTYAYIRDSAQHMKERMFRNMKLPKLVDDRDFTHDSEAYKAFFLACREHAVTRDKVEVSEYSLHGDVYAIREYVEQAAKRFLVQFDKIMQLERYANATPETIFEIEMGKFDRLNHLEMFWYAFRNKMPYPILESYFHENENVFTDETHNTFKILRYLMKMTPREYLENLRKEASESEATHTLEER